MPGSQATPKPLTHSPGVLSTIFSGLSKSLAGSAKILYVAIPQPENEQDDELSNGPQPGRCGLPHALSMDFPGRTSMLDGDTNPGINIAAAIKLDTSYLTTYVACSKDFGAVKSPWLYNMLGFVKTFEYDYNRVRTSTKTGRQNNIISIRITKQAYGAVTTSSSHRRILSGSTLAPSTSPTSPRSPAEEAPEESPTARGYGSLPQDTAVEEVEAERDKALQEDCDKRMFALADGLDLAWVPAKVNRNLWAREAEKNSDKYRSSRMTPMAEEHDRLEKRHDMVTAQGAPSIGSEDTINALSKNRADDLASLEKAAQREKQTMQAIIDDLAKDLQVARGAIARYEASKRTTIREGGSLLSDNLNFVESQMKIRNQLMGKENNVADIIPRPHTRNHAKMRTGKRNHTGVASETQSHAENLPVNGAKEEIAKLETRNDELASSKDDLTSRLKTSEDRARLLERLLSASNDHFATEISNSNSSNAGLREKVRSLSKTVENQKNLSRNAQDQLKSTTSVYKLKLKDQEEYYQQSLRALKTNVEKPLENETQLRRDIKAQFQKQFQKQFDDAMKKKAELRKEADARLEKRLISMKARGQQLVRYYAYLGIDLLEYMLKMEKLITSEGYLIENHEYDLFIAKARRALLYFKREEDDDAIFYGDEEDSEDEHGAEVDETEDEEEAEDEEEPDEDGRDVQGEEVVGQLAIEWRREAIIGDVDGITTSQDAEDLATGAEEVASSQEDGPIAKKAAKNFSFGTSQNNDTETTLPRNAAALSLNITSFTDTSRTATFTTLPTTPNPIPVDPQPMPNEPRTKLGKTRAQVEAEVAAALALRKTEEEKEASTTTAEEEKKTTARNPRKTKAERRAAAIDAQKEAAEKEEGVAKKKAKLRKQRR